MPDQKLLCEECRKTFQTLLTIGELGGGAFRVRELNNAEVCEYCDAHVLHDARDLMYWVPLSTVLLYECRMALMEERKKKLKNRSALEDVQSKLLIGVKLELVYGPKGLHGGRMERGPVSCSRIVSARTRTGVEFKDELGKTSEMTWPALRNLRLTERGFEIVDDREVVLLRYEWLLDAQLAAQ
jgi:hypothetical protein